MTRELLNTLFVLTPGAYVRLDGETLVVEAENQRLARVPLHHLGSVVLFERTGMSNSAKARCAAEGRDVTCLDAAGQFLWRLVGPTSGNVLLRRDQYQTQADPMRCLAVARAIVAGKIRNSRQTLARGARESTDEEATNALRSATDELAVYLQRLPEAQTLDAVRGIEGQVAAIYFRAFGHLLRVPRSEFAFAARTRRPPRDRVNALLSLFYALLTTDCRAALEGCGLDPQIGFLHTLRPGRPALALDLAEEFRSYLADRTALALINRRQIRPEHFEERPGGSVLLTLEGRRVALAAYQRRKQEEVSHPLLKDPAPIGLFPHLQARLLARHLRGELPTYPAFLAR